MISPPDHYVQESQLSQIGCATLHAVENFAKSLKVI